MRLFEGAMQVCRPSLVEEALVPYTYNPIGPDIKISRHSLRQQYTNSGHGPSLSGCMVSGRRMAVFDIVVLLLGFFYSDQLYPVLPY